MKKWKAAAWCLALVFCGCAHVVVRHVAENDKSCGVHFYEPRPYLLVTDQPIVMGTNGVVHSYTSTIIYLPDKSQRYVVQIKQGWGTVNGSVKLANGWMLDTLGAQTDSKGPETIAAVTGLLKEAGGLAMAVKTEEQPKAGLYRIDIDKDGNVRLTRELDWRAE
jgi:hypothetical protein